MRPITGPWLAFFATHGLAQANWQTRCSPAATPIASGSPRRPIITGACAHGDILEIGGRRWEIIVGTGHAPEHACLWTADGGILISGDQILPKITPNISVWASEPDASPLEDYLGSFANFSHLPDDGAGPAEPQSAVPRRADPDRPDRRSSPGAAGAAVRRFRRQFRGRTPVGGGCDAADVPPRVGLRTDGICDGRVPGPSRVSGRRGNIGRPPRSGRHPPIRTNLRQPSGAGWDVCKNYFRSKG